MIKKLIALTALLAICGFMTGCHKKHSERREMRHDKKHNKKMNKKGARKGYAYRNYDK